MGAGQRPSEFAMSKSHRKFAKVLSRQDLRQFSNKGSGDRQLADPIFGRNLPSGRGAHINLAVCATDKSANRYWHGLVTVQPPNQNVSVEQKAQNSLPRLQFLFRQRLEKFRSEGQLPLHGAKLTLLGRSLIRRELRDRRLASCDDNLLASLNLGEEPRKMRLGSVDRDRFHTQNLANLTNLVNALPSLLVNAALPMGSRQSAAVANQNRALA